MTHSTNYLDVYDILAIVIYFIVVLGVSIYSTCRPNRNTISGYFLAGRYMCWLPVGASLFASNIGSDHFIGLAGSGAAAGIGVGAFELNALVLLQLLGWVFLPVFIASGVCTLPEYMMKRFGGDRIRIYLALLSLILYIFTKISVNIYSGSLFIQQSVGWNLWYSILLLLAMTYMCTAIGGLAAVIYTDTLQFFIIIFGSLVVLVKGLIAVGGWSELQIKYFQAVPNATFPNTTCGIPREDSWIMLRDPIDSDMPWPGFLLGQTPASIWYWCADQMMVQRALAAKSLSHAQGGTLFAGFIKILPVFIMVIPGMISRILYADEVACVKPEVCEAVCDSTVGCTNSAYPRLVLGIMPGGFRGVMLAVMLAALMSDLTSVFNSASTLFTMDIWKKIRPKAGTHELLIISKIFIAVLVVISIIWIPIIQSMQGGQLYIYIQSVAAYLAPPIAAVYCMALIWPRMNEKGAFWGLMTGLVIGLGRMALDFCYHEPVCYEKDMRPAITSKVHYMYFAVLLFWVTVVLCVIVSYLTPPTEQFRLIRTTFMTRFDKSEREDERENQEPLNIEEVELDEIVDDKKKVDMCCQEKREVPEVSVVASLWKKLYNWACGIEDNPERARQIVQDMEERSKKISKLEQTSKEKWVLNSCLVVILSCAVLLYTIFSINPFPPDVINKLRMEAYYRIINQTES